MKLRILSLYLIIFLTDSHVFSQWVQTNGPCGSVNATAFFTFDSLNYLTTKCGLFTSRDINVSWNLETAMDIKVYLILDDSIVIANTSAGLSMIDLTNPGFDPQPLGSLPGGINAVANSDSYLYAGTDYGGFYKSAGFTDEWEWMNAGLPVDSGIIPPKFGGGKYYHHFVYAIETTSQYIFAGTQRGIYRTDPEIMIWESVNTGLPLSDVSLIKKIADNLFICIDKAIYRSDDNGESWEQVYISGSAITSITEIEGALYLTMQGAGILLSVDNGKNWSPFNNGLDDLYVNFLGITDSVMICGTSKGGFYYFDGGIWKQNNSGIICNNVRSIVRSGNSLIANDYNEIYISGNGTDWNSITPQVSMELFGGMAAMGDTVFVSVEYDTPSWPYDQPYIIYTPDQGSTWKELNNPVPFARDDPYGIYCFGKKLYAFEDEIMFFTDNLGSTWIEASLAAEFCNYFYDFIVFNSTPFAVACGYGELVRLNENYDWELSNSGLPSDRGISRLAYCQGALFAYVDYTGMYISRDNGNSWNPVNGSINVGYYVSSFVPYGKSLFVTSRNGIFYTNDYGQSWSSLNSGLPNTDLSSIVIHNDTLYLGTFGNGIWKCSINAIPLSLPKPVPDDESLNIYPNPASDFIRLPLGDINAPFEISIMDLSGREMFSEIIWSDELSISGLENGTYIIKAKSGVKQVTGKIVIMK